MEFQRTVHITASLPEVWTLVDDIPAVASCIPGLHDLELTSAHEFGCIISQRVGSVKANFALRTVIVDMEPQCMLTAVSEGRDDVLNSSVKATQQFSFSSEGPGTDVEIRAQFQVTGKIATFGQRIISAKAEQVTVETLRNVSEVLAARRTEPSS